MIEGESTAKRAVLLVEKDLITGIYHFHDTNLRKDEYIRILKLLLKELTKKKVKKSIKK